MTSGEFLRAADARYRVTGAPAAGRLTGVGVGPGDPELLTVRATRLIAAADVIAYHRDRHGGSAALAAAQPYLRGGQAEEILQFPVTTQASGQARRDLLAGFWEEAAARLAAHLEAGRDVVVLCAGDPALSGSYQHLHTRLSGRFAAAVVPGISSVSAAAAAVSVPLVQHDEILTVLPGTLPDDRLRAALAGSDAVVVLRLGRALGRVRTALDGAGLLSRARYVERAGTEAERVVPLSEADPDTVPDMSLALVPAGPPMLLTWPRPAARSRLSHRVTPACSPWPRPSSSRSPPSPAAGPTCR